MNARTCSFQRFALGTIAGISLFLAWTAALPAQIVYLACAGDNVIYQLASDGSVATFATTGLDYPWGLAFDGAGNLFVMNGNSNNIEKSTPTASARSSPAMDLTLPAVLPSTRRAVSSW